MVSPRKHSCFPEAIGAWTESGRAGQTFWAEQLFVWEDREREVEREGQAHLGASGSKAGER